ncbi:unnamed protein product [Clavelina lepadiformis]|uniref:Uncharacterized protein n=1 Tax=Clavelina lepadiformis TaxID=159417 RepID=A0ABP0FDT0_CLALP
MYFYTGKRMDGGSKENLINADNAHNYALEVLKCIGQMKDQDRRLSDEIRTLDSEKRKLQNDIRFLTDKLAKINYQIAKKMDFQHELRKTTKESEAAYSKLLESSQVLCKSVKETKIQMLGPNVPSTVDIQQLLQSAAMDTRALGPTSNLLRERDPKNEGVAVAAAVANELAKK